MCENSATASASRTMRAHILRIIRERNAVKRKNDVTSGVFVKLDTKVRRSTERLSDAYEWKPNKCTFFLYKL